MKETTNRIDQMELGLDANTRRLARQARRQRRQRAQWWFAQMRRVVGAALEWRPETKGRPAQACLALAAKRP
jgi:hypothetical protein